MADIRDNKSGYSIPRSFKPVVVKTVVLVAVSDAVLLLSLLLIIGIRNILGIDAELIGVAIVLFGLKTLVTVYGVYRMMQYWLGVTYYVVQNKLYVQSEIRQLPSSIYELKDIARVVADQSYTGFSKQDYGTVKISFVRSTPADDITLIGVKDPEAIARQLSKGIK